MKSNPTQHTNDDEMLFCVMPSKVWCFIEPWLESAEKVLYPARDDFLSGFARLSHENVYTNQPTKTRMVESFFFLRTDKQCRVAAHCSLFSDSDFYCHLFWRWDKKDLNQIELFSLSFSCMRIKQNISFVLSLTTFIICLLREKFSLLNSTSWQASVKPLPKKEKKSVRRMKSGYHHIFAYGKVQRTQQHTKKSIIDWFFGMRTRVGGLCAFDFFFATTASCTSLSTAKIVWVVDVFSSDFRHCMHKRAFVHKEISGFY